MRLLRFACCSGLWSVNTDLIPIAASLGADVPSCVHSQTMWGEGVGDVLKPFDDDRIAGTFVLLVNPGIACPTGPIFAAWDGIDRGALDPNDWTTRATICNPRSRIISRNRGR